MIQRLSRRAIYGTFYALDSTRRISTANATKTTLFLYHTLTLAIRDSKRWIKLANLSMESSE
jgi:hypothetical protein